MNSGHTSLSAMPGSPLDAPHPAVESLNQSADHSVTSGGGARVKWRRWGRGRPLVLVHGGAGSWRHWTRNIAELAEHRTVIAPDMPGYGDSDLPADPHSVASMADALSAGIEALLPPEQGFDLAGFSFGSLVSILVAHRLAARIDRLILVGSRYVDNGAMRWDGLVNWKRITDPVAREAALRNNMRTTMIADDEHIDSLALHLYCVDVLKQRLRPATLRDGTAVAAELAKVPTTIRVAGISGRHDHAYGDIGHLQAPGLTALRPEARLHVIDDASHWVMYEQAPIFNQLLLKVLE